MVKKATSKKVTKKASVKKAVKKVSDCIKQCKEPKKVAKKSTKKGTKKGKAANPWMAHLASVWKAAKKLDKNASYSDTMKKAKSTYKK